jgi:hypothetical protein
MGDLAACVGKAAAFVSLVCEINAVLDSLLIDHQGCGRMAEWRVQRNRLWGDHRAVLCHSNEIGEIRDQNPRNPPKDLEGILFICPCLLFISYTVPRVAK